MRERVIPQLDAGEFLHWEARQSGKFELHDGFVVSFAGGTFAHNRIVNNLRTALERAYPPPCGVFSSDIKVQAGTATFFYPDVGVVCEDVPDDATIVTTPVVVVEVLSETTRAFDVGEKRDVYRSISSLEFYVVVHTRSRRVEVDARRPGGTWSTSIVDAGSIAIGRSEITIDEIYARTQIAATS
jgi:Uma2 family endonuclease